MSKYIASKILKIKSDDVTTHPQGRSIIGIVTSSVNIVLNTILGVSKIIVGALFGSISVINDGVNNITDTASAGVSAIGFKLSTKPADKDHPFGHARTEYLATIIIAIFIIMVGIELATTSIGKIISASPTNFSIITVIVLSISIAIKFMLFGYNLQSSRLINSNTLKSIAIDCISDSLSTIIVLICIIISKYTGVNLDGYAGVILAVLIFAQGIKLLVSTCSPLIGEKPDKSMVKDILNKVNSYEDILGTHDLIIHNYGPNKHFASLHAEVDADVDITESHELIDTIERELSCDSLHVIIHMDPVNTQDEITNKYRTIAIECIHDIDTSLSIHDFRVVIGPNSNNLIFDVVVPYDFTMKNDELISFINKGIEDIDSSCKTVINIDRNYINLN